ncbi:hypothetical protein BBJ29_000463 [Phytophthora kernoviae]|uniref:Temptin Cys/Cys disulfide domain-containing protein n=1 Tax=Phytophthora kernoviae TaxID=325452 RepID=A0A3F2RS92_9STRA|nr:hypothetical protein BBJ29_000463 [Phytophthora kernoviae]RLN63298.1 hypothetical protein BBP00_00004220 [Phytophthora kernoviae]
MIPTVQIAVVAAVMAQTVSAYSSYMALIPNGDSIGKTLGHTDTGYTDFGQLFSDDGTKWATVCTKTWPGGSVTCGEALGDPCCTWTKGDPDFALTEPNTDGTKCASGGSTAASGAATSTAASTASSAATTTSTASSGTTDASQETAASNTTTSAIGDSSEYCDCGNVTAVSIELPALFGVCF